MTDPALEIKIQLHTVCLAMLQQSIDTLERAMADAQAAANDETKSSAGDKYETGRAMMQAEKDKYARQLATALANRHLLETINPKERRQQVRAGSLVRTNEGLYYFSAPLGKITLEGKVYFALSMASPLGQALLEKKAGAEVKFQGRRIVVEGVW